MFDALIIGGGLAGWAGGHALVRAGFRAAIIERVQPALPAIGEHLPPQGVQALHRLGLGDLLLDPAHRPSPGLTMAWGEAASATRSYLGQPGGRAFHLDRGAFQAAMRQRALAAGLMRLQGGVTSLDGGPGAWRVAGPGFAIEARLLVDATGRPALVGRRLGARVARDDALTGLAARLPFTGSGMALRLEAMASGWWYAAPLTGQRLIAVALTDADLLPQGVGARLSWWRAEAFSAGLIRAMAPEIPEVSLRSVAAWSQRLVPSAGPGWLALGDAAMAFDPLASAGMTKALNDAADLPSLLREEFDPVPLEAMRQRRYAEYRAQLARTYAGEPRFAAAPFWQRRL
jgi:2-polyprenyl-6-methoxyphenol hydroxylase-like FAD-dependent oxidoreductase